MSDRPSAQYLETCRNVILYRHRLCAATGAGAGAGAGADAGAYRVDPKGQLRGGEAAPSFLPSFLLIGLERKYCTLPG